MEWWSRDATTTTALPSRVNWGWWIKVALSMAQIPIEMVPQSGH
jgi:hypothetical protein